MLNIFVRLIQLLVISILVHVISVGINQKESDDVF